VSPDSALFARGYDDRTVRVWDIDGKHAPMTLRGHLHAPEGLTFSPDSRTLATTTIYTRGFSKTEGLQRERGDFDYTIRLWPIPEARTVQFSAYATKASESDLRWVSFSPWVPDGRGLVLNDGLTLRLVDAKGELMAPPVEVPERHEHLKEPIFAADGGSVTFESANHWVRWDLRDPSRLEAIAHPEGEQRAVKAPREHGKGWSNLSRDGCAGVLRLPRARPGPRLPLRHAGARAPVRSRRGRRARRVQPGRRPHLDGGEGPPRARVVDLRGRAAGAVRAGG
jgi:hypothetical protein